MNKLVVLIAAEMFAFLCGSGGGGIFSFATRCVCTYMLELLARLVHTWSYLVMMWKSNIGT